jgi:esterase/lipase superfamily enzyme
MVQLELAPPPQEQRRVIADIRREFHEELRVRAISEAAVQHDVFGHLQTLLEKHELWIASGGKAGAPIDFVALGDKEMLPDAEVEPSSEELEKWEPIRRALSTGALVGVDLRAATLMLVNLDGAKLMGADMRQAVLAGSSLRNSDLRLAKLQDADLQGANLENADLSGADLSGATLVGAKLHKATLFNTKFDRANLQDADFSGAIFIGPTFDTADLQGARFDDAGLYGAKFGCSKLGRISGISVEELLQLDHGTRTRAYVFPVGNAVAAAAESYNRIRELTGAPARNLLSKLSDKEVALFYATTRDRTGEKDPNRFYANKRTEPTRMEMGTCVVSLPLRHKKGILERPSYNPLNWKENPDKHVVLKSIKPVPEDTFIADLKSAVNRAKVKEILVFIHGFNVCFSDAARRAGQIARDSMFRGVPVMFSWPSNADIKMYRPDEKNVGRSINSLERFLTNLATNIGATRVHLMAHSMGNLALTTVLERMASPSQSKKMFWEIVLTAPDVDAQEFREGIGAKIQKVSEYISLYVSSHDRALRISRRFNDGKRLGESDPPPLMPGIETIDSSTIDKSFTGHSYYARGPVLADIFYLIDANLRAPNRYLDKIDESPDGQIYWKLTKFE